MTEKSEQHNAYPKSIVFSQKIAGVSKESAVIYKGRCLSSLLSLKTYYPKGKATACATVHSAVVFAFPFPKRQTITFIYM